MRILFIISSLSSGGAERVLTHLANYLSVKHTIHIATFSNEEPFYKLDSKIVHNKLDLIKESKNKLNSLFNTFNRIKVLSEHLKEVDADINISFMTHTNILSTIASRLNKQKIIIAERIVYSFYDSVLLNICRKIVYSYSDFLITQTIEDEENYSFVKNVSVIYNPINIKNINKEKENIVLAVGRLDNQKRFDKLIKAFSKASQKEWKLCIAGDGIEKDNLQYLIKNLKNDNIELIGKRKDIFDWYAKSSIFVLSSVKEGFPNVLIEAMAYGCACISFDCPSGPVEIIENEKNGILVENQNIEELGFQIQRLMNDKNLRDKLSKEAIKVKEKYNIDKIANQWEEIIYKVVNEND